MTQPVIEVLLIEDDPMVQEVNRQFIEQVAGFQVAAIASDGEEGLALARELTPDLILLDIYMPEKDGVETLEYLRGEQLDIDVIVITAANDKGTIKKMLQHGAADYIVKPFKFDRLEQALTRYRELHVRFSGEGELGQQQIDDIIQTPKQRSFEPKDLPKGLNEQTLHQITLFLKEQQEALSAEQVADGIGIARVTARRYLDYLKNTGDVVLDIQYGGVGRPVNRYKISQ
ncbi:two-component system, CitB family, response regulator DctR [Thalassobacillus cyri]|uniref:Two-component system, CitB family, response regulator DctR n=1 Tax=Thalassobacillus cyri TaxID=571932 RepID=A0A1H3Z9T2_9BACI|nr:response regulator [Thalassobacillus cyri]SEA20092.1 two-component system, CitB family, response regulator DctR [Thalassobacillus cyri]